MDGFSTQRPGRFSPVEKSRYPLYKKLGGVPWGRGDGYGIPRFHRGSTPGPYNFYQVAIPTTVSLSTCIIQYIIKSMKRKAAFDKLWRLRRPPLCRKLPISVALSICVDDAEIKKNHPTCYSLRHFQLPYLPAKTIPGIWPLLIISIFNNYYKLIVIEYYAAPPQN